MTGRSAEYRAISRILAGALCISFSGVWVVWSRLDPMASAFYRVLFGAVFLACICLATGRVKPLSPKTAVLAGLCGVFFAADLFCWHVSISHIGPGLATILGNFQVFVLAAASIAFFGQPVRLAFLLSLPLAFTGLYLLIGIDWAVLPEHHHLGVYYGIATALFYAGFILLLRAVQQSQSDMSMFYGLLLVSIVSTAVLGLGLVSLSIEFTIPSPASLGALIGLALVSQTIGWALISGSLPRVLPSVAGLVLLLQPSLAFVWDVLIFARPTDAVQWLGVVVTLIAIYLGLSAAHKPR